MSRIALLLVSLHLSVCSLTGMNHNTLENYWQLLPADIVALTTRYIVENGKMVPNAQRVPALTTIYSFYRQYRLPHKNNMCIEAFKAFFDPRSVSDSIYFNDVPLSQAVHSNNTPLARILLLTGAVADMVYPYSSYTLLSCAAESGYIEMVELLLEAGANPNPHKPTASNKGKPTLASPLVCALKGNSRNAATIVKLLLNAGAEKNLPDARGQTPLSFLAAHPPLANAKKARELLANYTQKH